MLLLNKFLHVTKPHRIPSPPDSPGLLGVVPAQAINPRVDGGSWIYTEYKRCTWGDDVNFLSWNCLQLPLSSPNQSDENKIVYITTMRKRQSSDLRQTTMSANDQIFSMRI